MCHGLCFRPIGPEEQGPDVKNAGVRAGRRPEALADWPD